ncbi:MAG TPA: hydrolase [Burkholderiales bacterium]
MSLPFEPAWWCRNPHLQTILPNRMRPRPAVAFRRERIELPDGDFADIDWSGGAEGPIVLLLHGLQGSSRSRYAAALARAFGAAGWRTAVLHFRGCSGEPNRLPRSYHSGETGDTDYVVRLLHAREPQAPLAAVGVSLGGNVLLKWLGERGADAPVCAAVAISVPFVLARAAERLESGFARIYQWELLYSLCAALEAKRRSVQLPLALGRRVRFRRMRDFDDCVTAPLHGFRDAAHYYEASSSRPYLPRIRVPTLLIQARDDPFMYPDVIPEPHELPPCVTLEAHEHGGHVGFVGGRWPWRPRYYLEERVPQFLRAHLVQAEDTREHREAPALGEVRG